MDSSFWFDTTNLEWWPIVRFDSLHPSQKKSVMSGYVFQGLTSTKQGLMCLASEASEARTCNPSASRQALYHWATALPEWPIV